MIQDFINQHSYNFLSNATDQSKELDTIKQVLSEFVENNALTLGQGYCISISDMLNSALRHRGIKSKMIEVTLTYSVTDRDGKIFTEYVGFDDIPQPGKIDTHVVLITETTPPYLIDGSIQHMMPPNVHAIIEEVPFKSDVLLHSNFVNYGIQITYKLKAQQKIPVLYQKSILDRIQTDNNIFNNLKLLKILIAVALIISSLNAVRGSYDFYQVYFNDENYRGLSGIEKINERLDRIEKNTKD
jgi:hypothetical protein